jgi:hypothetical protein
MRYRGRFFSEEEIQIIKRLIEEAPPPKYRKPLSKKKIYVKPSTG